VFFSKGRLKISSEASPQTDENRKESISPQRRRGHREMIHLFFAAETPAKKIVMPFGQALIDLDNLPRALALFLFCPPPPCGMFTPLNV